MCMCCTEDRLSGGLCGHPPYRDFGMFRVLSPALGALAAAAKYFIPAHSCATDVRRRNCAMVTKEYPCTGCTRVLNPEACENKNCKIWKAWFLRHWAAIYGFGRRYGLQKQER